ncbi:MAG: hypothetical protein GX045_10400 [Clostridiaceae bacterium]|nr:hypothetical protein [Clostridiaceae bacterium]
MDTRYIIRALRPLKRKIHFERAVKSVLYMLLAAGIAVLILAMVSLFAVVPFVRMKMLAILTIAFFAGIIAALFLVPSQNRVIITADSLGLEERVITTWYLKDDNSPVSMLQREDTIASLGGINLKKAYKFRISKELIVSVFVIIVAAFLVSFIPGKVADDTRLLESLITEMNKQEEMLEKELEKQMKAHQGMSVKQLEELKALLEKLKEEFDKAKTEEDALKALAQMENLLEKLKEQNPQQDLKALENMLAGSSLTESLGGALKNEDEEALKEALDRLKKELENMDNREELSELIKQAAQNMANNSMMAEALDKIASSASDGSLSGEEIAQSLKDLIEQAMENASGMQDFMQAAGNLGEAAKRAKLAIASVGRYIAQGRSSGNAQQGGQNQGSQSENKERQPGGQGQGGQSGDRNHGDQDTSQGQGGQNGSQGQGDQPGNQGQGGQSQGQGEDGGAGAGSGSTNEDAGYNEGDQPGSGRAPGDRKGNEYRSIYIPERLGGEGNESLISGQKLQSGSSTFIEADGAPVQKGVMLPWNEVLSEYREEAVQSMERQDIPAGLEMLVRDYFSSLE